VRSPDQGVDLPADQGEGVLHVLLDHEQVGERDRLRGAAFLERCEQLGHEVLLGHPPGFRAGTGLSCGRRLEVLSGGFAPGATIPKVRAR